MTKKLLETVSSASSHDMKVEEVVGGVELAASSTVSEERRTGMRKLMKEMSLVCSTCDIDLKNWAEEHKLGLGEGLRGLVDRLLSDPLWNLYTGQNGDRADYMCSDLTR